MMEMFVIRVKLSGISHSTYVPFLPPGVMLVNWNLILETDYCDLNLIVQCETELGLKQGWIPANIETANRAAVPQSPEQK
jgi:hypothetical protein